ncbi:hypothetical protein DQF20_23275 [Escherichia coli]|uniref:Uncharacterized protein n=1 Tax=Escherichia coli TaxID=562 RepID=A0AAN3NXY2_ECOLX|nr:hypothetical protein [Escherichia coli]EGE1749193.1 hypothetical protein [Shigella flexneri]QGU62058.1 hypothetical protein CUC37_02090 [Shigella boydii]EAA4820949.1 hypothetical protein [Escherichia coli]EAC0484357.1 hypothetical protein [Escherichia coli]
MQPAVENPATDASHRSSEISRWVHSGRPEIQVPPPATAYRSTRWSEHSRARARYVWGLILYLYLYLS